MRNVCATSKVLKHCPVYFRVWRLNCKNWRRYRSYFDILNRRFENSLWYVVDLLLRICRWLWYFSDILSLSHTQMQVQWFWLENMIRSTPNPPRTSITFRKAHPLGKETTFFLFSRRGTFDEVSAYPHTCFWQKRKPKVVSKCSCYCFCGAIQFNSRIDQVQNWIELDHSLWGEGRCASSWLAIWLRWLRWLR